MTKTTIGAPVHSKDVFDEIEERAERDLEELLGFLRIPSISTDPEYRGEVERCSEFLRLRMDEAGLAARRIETAGHPLVYGEWCKAPGRPTLLFYGHYDVQPADPVEAWRSPPFEPTIDGDEILARGASDDKGQLWAHLAAVAAVLRRRGALPVNVKFLVEGEEESGSSAIERFVREDAGRLLACDAVVISDGAMYSPGQPSLIYGLKGIAYFELRVSGPDHDLHSGIFGGAVENPANALCRILASLRDPETGRVLIPGFYDAVRPLEAWEREEFARLPFDEAAYARAIGVEEVSGEAGYTTLERTWARPTCDIHGLWSGYQGDGAKTIIPARAGAKVSMRLVPDQNPQEIAGRLIEHVEQVAPAGVRVEIDALNGTTAALINIEGPAMEAVQGALKDVWGRRPLRLRNGGSLPIVSTFSEVLEVPVAIAGYGLPDDRIHAPNEKFNVSHFYNGMRTTVRLLDRLADAPTVRAGSAAGPAGAKGETA